VAATIPEKIGAQNELSSALSRLLLVVENYPQLKADQNFIRLQDELAGTRTASRWNAAAIMRSCRDTTS